jgi:hypothetical protein
VVIPTAIVAGLILGVWIRWWAVPIVVLGWAVVIAFADPSSAIGVRYWARLMEPSEWRSRSRCDEFWPPCGR